MQKIIKRIVLIAAAALALGGCGDNSTTAPPNKISLEPLKAVYGGTAPDGTQYHFNLSGTDTTGKAYTGSYTLTSKGETVLDGQKVYHSREEIQLQTNGQTANQETRDTYWDDPNWFVYRQLITSQNGTIKGGPENRIVEDEISIGECDNGRTETTAIMVNDSPIQGLLEERYRNEIACTQNTDLQFKIPAIGNLTLSSRYTIAETTYEKSVGFYLTPEGKPSKMTLKIMFNGALVTLNSN